MASRDFFILLVAIAVFLPATAMATKYWVGDKAGWTIGVDYHAWAKDKVFLVGDTLIFVYQKGNDSVFPVNQNGYQNCMVPVGSPGFTTGHDEIAFATPGMKWYISGAPEHCSHQNQKLAINVIQEGAPAPAPASGTSHAPAPAPAPFTPAPAPMTPWTPSPPMATTPPPPGSSAPGTHGSSEFQVLFVATVFAALLMA